MRWTFVGLMLAGVPLLMGTGCSSEKKAAPVPTAPLGLSVEAGDAENTVQWFAVPGATSYNLYWADTYPVVKESAHLVPNAVSPYHHTGLVNGVHYYYAVTAANGGGESSLSSEMGAMPKAPVTAPPQTVTPTPGDGVVDIAWTPVARASAYNVYWSKAAGVVPGGQGVSKIAAIAGTAYAHTGLTNGDTYHYVVTALNIHDEESAPSAEVSARPMPPAPAAPATLVATPGDTTVSLAWTPSAGATSYNLYWSKAAGVAPGGPGVTRIAGLTGTSYQHVALVNGDTYFYVVTAVGFGGEGAPSPEGSARPLPPAPGIPENLAAVPGDTVVDLQWSPVEGATSYAVYWSNAPGVVPGGAGVAKHGLVPTLWQHAGLTNGRTYYYVVTAVNLGGESAPSAEKSATPEPPAPGPPATLTATSGDTLVNVAWSPSAGATSYSLYWSTAGGVAPGGAGVTQIAGLTGTTYQHTGLVNGDTYFYVVTAVGPGGEGPPSAEASARPLPPPPPAPLGLTAIAPKDAAEVTIQWYDVTDYPTAANPIQLGYNLYRGQEPGLAAYYRDPARAKKYANVTAPMIDDAVVAGTTYYYVVTAFVPDLPDVESVPSGEVSATIASAGGGGGGDTGFGNNLSFPLVFADAHGLAGAPITGTWPGTGPFTGLPAMDYATGLRPLSTETLAAFPFFDATTAVSLGGTTYYPQATASTWQAEWRSNAEGSTLDVIVDWGDALLSKTYTVNSIVRVETALVQNATIAGVTDTMTAYQMALLSGSQTTELQGTSTTTYASATRNVFAINARLRIEKLADNPGGSDQVVFDKAVYESFGASEGGSTVEKGYAGELNVGGSVVFGYNFQINKITGLPSKTGQYRITFLLDPQATVGSAAVPNHVRMVAKADAGAVLAADGLSSSVVINVQ